MVDRTLEGAGAAPLTRYQFERLGYFCVDPDTTKDKVVCVCVCLFKFGEVFFASSSLHFVCVLMTCLHAGQTKSICIVTDHAK